MPTLSRVLQPIGPTCAADVSAADAVKQLAASGADALLVVKSGAFVGLFGYREALTAFADGAGPVEFRMTRLVLTGYFTPTALGSFLAFSNARKKVSANS